MLGLGASVCSFHRKDGYKDLAAERGTFGLTLIPGKPDTTKLDMKKLLSHGLGRRIMDHKVRAWFLMDRGLCCLVGSHRSDPLERVQERKKPPLHCQLCIWDHRWADGRSKHSGESRREERIDCSRGSPGH